MRSALGRQLGFPSTFATAFVAALFLQTPELARAEIGSDETPVGSSRPQVEVREMEDGEFPFELRKVADKLESPWAMAFLPDGRILVTERAGRLRVIEGDQLVPRPIGGVPTVLSGSHSGLLDVLVDPDFQDNHRVFLSYMHGTPNLERFGLPAPSSMAWTLSTSR